MGDPDKVRTPDWKGAIIAYREGKLEECLRLFPGACRAEREVAKRLLARPDEWERALRGVDPRLRSLYLNAFQSYLFDKVLEERLPALDRIEEGDLAWKHANGACFLVTDVAAETPRAAAFEISPTGPLFGSRMTLPAGAVLERESRILAAEELTLEDFNLPDKSRMEGERRPLRVPLSDPLVESDPEGLVLSFALPKGSYATAVLREVMKTG
jgi:tRNA pseudouridine13 synthase